LAEISIKDEVSHVPLQGGDNAHTSIGAHSVEHLAQRHLQLGLQILKTSSAAEAIPDLQKAAELGDRDAMYFLAKALIPCFELEPSMVQMRAIKR